MDWTVTGTNVTRELLVQDTLSGNRYVTRLLPKEYVTAEAETATQGDAAAIVANARAGGTATILVAGVSISGSVSAASAKQVKYSPRWQVSLTIFGETVGT